MKVRVISALVLLASFNAMAETPQCAAAALVQAEKLLLFHTDGDDRAVVDAHARQLLSLTNPANTSQKLAVFEVMGHVYKGEYRMRLIYYPLGRECVLIGQEILELANL